MPKIKIIILETGKEAYVKEIERDLQSMQKVVGGLIQAKPSTHLKKKPASLSMTKVRSKDFRSTEPYSMKRARSMTSLQGRLSFAIAREKTSEVSQKSNSRSTLPCSKVPKHSFRLMERSWRFP